MSLPLKAVDRLFDRLTATYGREWVNRWDGLDQNAVKTMWAYELSAYANNLHAIAYALEHLPERSPNVIEFRNLCRAAPSQVQALPAPEPKADPARVAAEMAKLRVTMDQVKPGIQVDHKAWAKRILTRHEAGEKLSFISVQFAKEALRAAA